MVNYRHTYSQSQQNHADIRLVRANHVKARANPCLLFLPVHLCVRSVAPVREERGACRLFQSCRDSTPQSTRPHSKMDSSILSPRMPTLVSLYVSPSISLSVFLFYVCVLARPMTLQPQRRLPCHDGVSVHRELLAARARCRWPRHLEARRQGVAPVLHRIKRLLTIFVFAFKRSIFHGVLML
jgi:hypothetical protein